MGAAYVQQAIYLKKVGTYAVTGAVSSSYILIADHYTLHVCPSTDDLNFSAF